MASNFDVTAEFVAGLFNASYRRLVQVLSGPDLNRKVDGSNKNYKDSRAVHYIF